MSNIGSYEERLPGFDWAIAKEVLNWQDGELLNIGHMATDRICAQGKADKTALIWEGDDPEQSKHIMTVYLKHVKCRSDNITL